MRHKFKLSNPDLAVLKSQLLQWCKDSEYSSFLDSNAHKDKYSKFDWLAGIGAKEIVAPQSQHFETLQKALDFHQDWLFGHMTYDLKNSIEDLSTSHPDTIGFLALLFFVPQQVVYSANGEVWVESTSLKSESEFLKELPSLTEKAKQKSLQLLPKTNVEDYLRNVQSLKDELQYGNIYEVNYCIEFASKSEDFDPLKAFEEINKRASAPFSSFYKNRHSNLICTSPERYIQKDGEKIISQPIKGTIRRDPNPQVDKALKDELYNNEKERSENVMITDLVRNDLSKTAARGSVTVEELFGTYTFNTVHQMISTVCSTLSEKYKATDILKTTFPMGSMTGAPKISAMKLIDSHENFARNLYSGSVGYFTPNGDFDFNVVIRSLLYNSESKYLSARVGSAITIHCDAQKEYEECLLKAENLFAALR